LVSEARKEIVKSSVETESILKDDSVNSVNMTFGEFFDKAKNTSASIEESKVKILSSGLPKEEATALASYADQLENVVGLEEQSYRKAMAASTANDLFKSALEDYRSTPYNEYSDKWERHRVTTAITDVTAHPPLDGGVWR
jgi:hypothetical protein